MSIIDLNHYAHKANLQLCLALVEDAFAELKNNNYDLAETQLQDILDTFDDIPIMTQDTIHINAHTNNIISFQRHRE